MLQQRTFSLQLLAKVIQRARHNEYSSDSVLEQLLASDVPLLLRYSLDENVSSVMFAAAAGLHSLLVTPPENVSYLGWCNIEIFYVFYSLACRYCWRNTCSLILDVFYRL